MLHRKNRAIVTKAPYDFRVDVQKLGVLEIPVSTEIAILSQELDSGFPADPADRIIAATALAQQGVAGHLGCRDPRLAGRIAAARRQGLTPTTSHTSISQSNRSESWTTEILHKPSYALATGEAEPAGAASG